MPWCLAVTVPLGTALSLVRTGLSRYVSQRPRLQTRRCQGGPPALTVPAARCPGPSVCLAAPRVRRATSQPCLHILPTPSTPRLNEKAGERKELGAELPAQFLAQRRATPPGRRSWTGAWDPSTPY